MSAHYGVVIECDGCGVLLRKVGTNEAQLRRTAASLNWQHSREHGEDWCKTCINDAEETNL